MSLSQRLVLSDASFQALEDAYEKQWHQAVTLQEQQQERCGRHASSNSAGKQKMRGLLSTVHAAEEMECLLGETRRLHRRFQQMRTAGSTAAPFTEEERRQLALLGFAAPTAPTPPSQSHHREVQDKQSCEQTQKDPQQKDIERAKKDDLARRYAAENTTLKLENAQLQTALAWYRFRANEVEDSGATSAAAESLLAGAPENVTASHLYAQFMTSQKLSESLYGRTHAAASLAYTAPTSVDRTAVDVAVEELLTFCRFPPEVLVQRAEATDLYVLDRPVWIRFKDAQSSTLLVQDPEGLEPECELRLYLTRVYQPLLRALKWGQTVSFSPSPSAATFSAAADRETAQEPPRTAVPSAVATATSDSRTAEHYRAAFALTALPSQPIGAPPSRLFRDGSASASDVSEGPPQQAFPTPTALSQMTHEELIRLKRATWQRLGRAADGAAAERGERSSQASKNFNSEA